MNKDTKIIWKNIDDLKPYEHNAKEHDETQVKNIAKSIEKYGWQNPVLIDKDNVIIAGHGRVLGAQELGLSECPCIYADDLTEEQVREYRILDNKLNESSWIDEELEFELPELDFSDFDLDFDVDLDIDEPKEINEGGHNSLNDTFIVPPFSILDTRQGYWQDRKRAWKNIGIQSEIGRDEHLLGKGLDTLNKKYLNDNPALRGKSIFDPVLCEISYKWFCTNSGRIYDCFAGGSVRGIVAEKLGYDYYGIDLRKEQIEANYKNAEEIGCAPHWFCDDSLNADKYIEDNSVDLIFSCPPYADLEVYSDDPRDISNMNYDDFCEVYQKIIDIACRKLKDDRFAIFVVGDVRDRNGFYRNFTDETKQCFIKNGLKLYNELCIIEQIGTGALRAGKKFTNGRKVVKCHQYMLVFYKGNPKNIKNNYDKIVIDEEILDFIEE